MRLGIKLKINKWWQSLERVWDDLWAGSGPVKAQGSKMIFQRIVFRVMDFGSRGQAKGIAIAKAGRLSLSPITHLIFKYVLRVLNRLNYGDHGGRFGAAHFALPCLQK